MDTTASDKATRRRRFLSGSGALVLTTAVLAACGGSDKPKTGPKILLPDSSHPEKQQFGADTFVNYRNASGPGPKIAKEKTVYVDCLATDPQNTVKSAAGKWYHVRGPDEFAGFYVAANTFENGDTRGPVSEQPAVDPKVPACP